ncbi:MAG: hypothetical protein QXT19_03590 [Candidatus Woesearchaeota archaeon]
MVLELYIAIKEQKFETAMFTRAQYDCAIRCYQRIGGRQRLLIDAVQSDTQMSRQDALEDSVRKWLMHPWPNRDFVILNTEPKCKGICALGGLGYRPIDKDECKWIAAKLKVRKNYKQQQPWRRL